VDPPASLLPAVLRTHMKAKKRTKAPEPLMSDSSSSEQSLPTKPVQQLATQIEVGKPWRFETQIKAEPSI
jgi:hypothetical protein